MGGSGLVVLNWPASANATSYKLKRSPTSGGPYSTTVSGVTGTSYFDMGLANGTTYYYVVSAVNAFGESGNLPQAAATPGVLTLPSPWSQQDIGAVGATGSGGYSGGSFLVQGSGADIWYSADKFHFAYLSVTNDCSITARVVNMQNTAPWAKAGVMIRESLNTNSRYAIVFMSPVNGVAFQRRGSGSASGVSEIAGVGLPHWVRLVRSANTFTAYVSPDGSNWTAFGTNNNSMASSAHLGFAVCNVNDGTLCLAQFDNVSWTPVISAPPTPTGLVATAGDSQATLHWMPSANATGYNLKRSTTDGGPYATLVANMPGLSFTNTGLNNRTMYYYVVSATNSAGESANSLQASARPVSRTPPQTDFAVSGNQLQLTWPADHTGWLLQAQTNPLNTGLGTSWVTVANSSLTNCFAVPVAATNASVFFRLVYP